jgi:two-component system CheB/CheR fusion protein
VAIGQDSHVASEPAGDADLANTLRLVRTATGVDFTHYKHSTLTRRIKRRMALRGFETLHRCNRALEQNREEAHALGENFFITVTQFFREPALFDELKKTVFPALVENRGPGAPIRMWVPGCASG